MSLLPFTHVCRKRLRQIILMNSLTWALLPVSFPMIFFSFLRQKELCFTHVYMQLYLSNFKFEELKENAASSPGHRDCSREPGCCRSNAIWLLFVLTPALPQSVLQVGKTCIRKPKILYSCWQRILRCSVLCLHQPVPICRDGTAACRAGVNGVFFRGSAAGWDKEQ